MKEGWFTLRVRKNFLRGWWYIGTGCPERYFEAPSLKTFEVRLNGALSNLKFYEFICVALKYRIFGWIWLETTVVFSTKHEFIVAFPFAGMICVCLHRYTSMHWVLHLWIAHTEFANTWAGRKLSFSLLRLFNVFLMVLLLEKSCVRVSLGAGWLCF